MQRPRPQCHCGLLGLLPKLHRGDHRGMAACPLSGRPFPYGQEYLEAPQKIAVILPQANSVRHNSCWGLRRGRYTIEFYATRTGAALSFTTEGHRHGTLPPALAVRGDPPRV